MRHLLTIALAIMPVIAAAQQTPPAGAASVVERSDSADFVYSTLHENAPRVVNVKDVPRFAILGKEGKFYIGLGANIKAIGMYDFGNVVESPNYFATSAIPTHPAPGNGGEFKFSAGQSVVYLNVVALPGTSNQLGAYVAVNFLGNNYAPKIRHAYLKYRRITAGYTYTLFSDMGAAPPTIDYEGPNSIPAILHCIAAYEPRFGASKMWQAGISIEAPEYSFTNAAQTTTVTQRMPDIPFYIQRYWAGGKGWLRISGMIRNLYYRNLATGHNIDKVGWAVKASGTTPIIGGLSASAMALYGKGIADYVQDLNGSGLDLLPVSSDPSRLKTIGTWAGYASLHYQFTPKLFATGTYSHVRTYANGVDRSKLADSAYRYAQYAVANVFYNINSIVQVGAEYIYGRRVNYDGSQAHDNRIEAMLHVSF